MTPAYKLNLLSLENRRLLADVPFFLYKALHGTIDHFSGLLLEWILQNQAGHLISFTQQKCYHFYTTEILFQTVKEVSKIKLMYASIADHFIAPIHIH